MANDRPIRVLFANANEQFTPALRAIIEHITGRSVTLIERADWGDLMAAGKDGFDVVVVNFTQTRDRESKGQTADFTTARISELKRRDRRMPVIIFTSWDYPGLIPRLDAAGADAVIRIPFTLNDVSPVFQKYIPKEVS